MTAGTWVRTVAVIVPLPLHRALEMMKSAARVLVTLVLSAASKYVLMHGRSQPTWARIAPELVPGPNKQSVSARAKRPWNTQYPEPGTVMRATRFDCSSH